MSVDELIQLIRTCNLAQFRQELEIWKKQDMVEYLKLVTFFKRAAKRK